MLVFSCPLALLRIPITVLIHIRTWFGIRINFKILFLVVAFGLSTLVSLLTPSALHSISVATVRSKLCLAVDLLEEEAAMWALYEFIAQKNEDIYYVIACQKQPSSGEMSKEPSFHLIAIL